MQIISGKCKGQKVVTPKGLKTRPTSSRLRESLFNICQTHIEGASFLDVFAGSGAMGIEALSRGAEYATFIDNDRESVRCINVNLANMQLKNHGQVLQGDVFTLMKRLAEAGKHYDIIYADPPYAAKGIFHGEQQTYSVRILHMVDQTSLLAEGGSLFIEESTASAPVCEGLKQLNLKSARRVGRSTLLHYRL